MRTTGDMFSCRLWAQNGKKFRWTFSDWRSRNTFWLFPFSNIIQIFHSKDGITFVLSQFLKRFSTFVKVPESKERTITKILNFELCLQKQFTCLPSNSWIKVWQDRKLFNYLMKQGMFWTNGGHPEHMFFLKYE